MSDDQARAFEIRGISFRFPWAGALAVTWLILASVATAQQHPTALPIEDESQVNSYTTGDQIRPAVAGDDAGNFVIVWQSDGAEDAAVGSALAQRFDSSGQAVAGEFRASFSTAGDNSDPDVSMAPNGEFTIVWTGPNFYGEQIAGQRYASDGSADGGVFSISQFTADGPGTASITHLPDGGFVVTWASQDNPPGGREVLARRFDSSGGAIGDSFQVNTYTTGDQEAPRIAADDAGDFVIVYESAEFTGETYRSVLAQRFDSSGMTLGDELLLVGSTTGDSRSPDVDTLTSGFVVAWVGPSVVADSLFVSAFDPGGSPLGSTQFPAGTISAAQNPRIATDADGQVIVTWSDSSDGDLRAIRAQAYDPLLSDTPLRPTAQVNVITTGDQMQPAVAAVGEDFVVAWSSEASAGSDQDLTSVSRRAVVIPLFSDGFEIGDTSSWSMTQP